MNTQEVVDQFIAITGEDADLAQWDIQQATETYYQGSASINTVQDGPKASAKDKKPVEYYAGGEKSGVAVEAPVVDQEQGNPIELVQDILKQAQENGEHAPQPKPKFTGRGQRLGDELNDSAPTEDSNDQIETVERELTFWKDGFSFGDGPLLRYDDPKNQKMLEIIKSGRVPPSLLDVPAGKQVDIKVAHRVNEAFVAPKKPLNAFSGTGNRLGSVVPTSPATAMPGSFPGSSSQAKSSASAPSIQVDSAQPLTTIQIRLADGTRMVAKFNHTHTVGDIRRYIMASRPEYAHANFILQTPLPVRVFSDDTISIKDAGLLNSVIAQRMG